MQQQWFVFQKHEVSMHMASLNTQKIPYGGFSWQKN